MEREIRTGLVLEGGGMRGVFTCGVLDWLLDNGWSFPYTVGVSAGACNGLSYMSRQRGRAKYSNIDMLKQYKYIGLKYLWTQHSILDQKLLYQDFPERLVPYDFEAYKANPGEFEMVTTNCLTGLPAYLQEKNDYRRLVRIAKASSSLPYVCPVVMVDRMPMLDGGIVDSIPVERAMARGIRAVRGGAHAPQGLPQAGTEREGAVVHLPPFPRTEGGARPAERMLQPAAGTGGALGRRRPHFGHTPVRRTGGGSAGRQHGEAHGALRGRLRTGRKSPAGAHIGQPLAIKTDGRRRHIAARGGDGGEARRV